MSPQKPFLLVWQTGNDTRRARWCLLFAACLSALLLVLRPPLLYTGAGGVFQRFHACGQRQGGVCGRLGLKCFLYLPPGYCYRLSRQRACRRRLGTPHPQSNAQRGGYDVRREREPRLCQWGRCSRPVCLPLRRGHRYGRQRGCRRIWQPLHSQSDAWRGGGVARRRRGRARVWRRHRYKCTV